MSKSQRIFAIIVLTIIFLSGYSLISSAIADPCADVKAGRVEFIDSRSCIDECAVDGGDCPYRAGQIQSQNDIKPEEPSTPQIDKTDKKENKNDR